MTEHAADSTAEGRDEAPLESAIELTGRTEQLRGLTVYAGVKLGIIDLLGSDSHSASEIASALDLADEHAARLLRALSVYGVLEETATGEFSLTPVGERFRAGHPESVRDFLLFFYDPKRFAAVRHLPDIVVDGDSTGYELEFGRDMFEMFEEHPAFSEHFNGMQDLSRLGETEQILDALAAVDFSQFSVICDVGGGYGELLCRLLDCHPHLEGIVLELESVLAEEDRLWASKLDVEDRCRYVAGDMFEAVPPADCYVLKAILHDWPDDDCVRILSNVHEAAPDDGRLLVRERVVSAEAPSPVSTTMDVWMLLETGGRERTRVEFETLFDRAGWHLDRVIGVEGDLCILEAVKA